MKFYLILFWFLYSFVSISQTEKDTIIEISGNNIDAYSLSIYQNTFHFSLNDRNSKFYFGVFDTNFKLLDFHQKVNSKFEIGFFQYGKIFAIYSKDNTLYQRGDSLIYHKLSKNRFKIPTFGYKDYEDRFVIVPDYYSRDSINNLYVQQMNYSDSLFQPFSLINSKNYGFCVLGNETKQNLIPYLLTSKDSGGFFEFGYFDSVFNRIDTFKFRHPNIQPNKGLNRFSAREIFVKNDLLYVAGSNQIKSTNNAPYKFTIDLKTKKIISTWQNVPKDLNANFSVFRINKYYFDSRGNLFFVGRADTKKDESWRNWHGFVQMVDTNNNLLVDTLYQFNPATNNETDFIYHLGGGRVILGGHYNYNTGITPAAWYKKFNIKDWYLPSVSIENQTLRKNTFSIYPNPTNNFFSIQGNLQDLKTIKLLDLNGAVLQVFKPNQTLDFSRFRQGSYILQIEAQSGKVERHKVIKQE